MLSAWSGVEEGSIVVGNDFQVYAKQCPVMGSNTPCAGRPLIYHAKEIDNAIGRHLLTPKVSCTHCEVRKIGKVGLAIWQILRMSTSATWSESNIIVWWLHTFMPPFSR